MVLGGSAPDCPRQVGEGVVLGAVAAHRPAGHARTAGDIVQIFHDDTVVATHVLPSVGRSTNFEHYPPHKIAHTLRSVTWCRRPGRADRARRGRDRRRTLAGERHPPPARNPRGHPAPRRPTAMRRLDAACARALAVGDPNYRTVKGILSPAPNTATTHPQAAPAAAGDPARPRSLRHRTHRLTTTPTSELILLQPHRP